MLAVGEPVQPSGESMVTVATFAHDSPLGLRIQVIGGPLSSMVYVARASARSVGLSRRQLSSLHSYATSVTPACA